MTKFPELEITSPLTPEEVMAIQKWGSGLILAERQRILELLKDNIEAGELINNFELSREPKPKKKAPRKKKSPSV